MLKGFEVKLEDLVSLFGDVLFESFEGGGQ